MSVTRISGGRRAGHGGTAVSGWPRAGGTGGLRGFTRLIGVVLVAVLNVIIIIIIINNNNDNNILIIAVITDDDYDS